MGLYDMVSGKIRCPYCGTDFMAEDQVKWTQDCCLRNYSVGEPIDADDGEYDYGSLLRDALKTQCPKCDSTVKFKAIVAYGRLACLEVVSNHQQEDAEEAIASEFIK